MNDGKKVLLFGATGLIGSHLLHQLLATGRIDVTAATRKSLALRHPQLHNIVTNFSALDAVAWPQDADTAFCCLGTTLKQAGSKIGFYAVDHDLVLKCAGWAKQLGVKHFIAVSAIGVSRSSPVYYNRVKAETEADLEAMSFPQLTLLQPSLLLGERAGPFRAGEALAIKISPIITPLMIGPLSPYTPVQAADVAAAMYASAQAPSGAAVERLRYRDIMALAH